MRKESYVTPASSRISAILAANDKRLAINYADIFLARKLVDQKYLVHFSSLMPLVEYAGTSLIFSVERYCLIDNDEMLAEIVLANSDQIIFVLKLDTFEVIRYD